MPPITCPALGRARAADKNFKNKKILCCRSSRASKQARMAGHSHRSAVKNGHKPFKSRHASKGAIKNRFKGKIEKESAKHKPVKNASKLHRKNLSKQLRENKIVATQEHRKVFEGVNGTERIVTIIPLTGDISCEEVANSLLGSSANDWRFTAAPCIKSLRIDKFKANLKFILPDMNNWLAVLDACKVSDFVIFGLSSQQEVDPARGETLLRALELQGIAHVLGVVTNLSLVSPKEKFQQDVKQSLTSYFKHFFPTHDKIYNLENASDSLIAIRTLCQKFPKAITWRDSRGWLVADGLDYDDASECLVVQGTVRGVGLNPNRLVHVPGLGDFQLSKIEKLEKNGDIELFESDETRDGLDELAPEEVDMDQDASDYDEDEFAVEKNLGSGLEVPAGKKLKLPKGTSEYQAKWFIEDDLEDDDDLEDEESSGESEGELQDDEMDVEDDTHSQYQDDTDNDDMFVELSAEEEQRQLEEYRQKEAEDREFPDEIELMPTESASERLKRYRGLKNLYNTVWDCDEHDDNKPEMWHRLLRISNFKKTKNKINKMEAAQAKLLIGSKVKLFIQFPKEHTAKIKHFTETPFIVYSLLQHEHKKAVVNFSIQSWEEYENPLPSKDTIIVQYGPRREVINPVYSDGTTTPNNVHKYQRFLHPGNLSIATAIAPPVFANSPALFFKQAGSTGEIEFIGHGSFLNVEHQRILAKRAIITGHPLKIHKNVVTIRYMFFNPQDIHTYKHVPLFTKSGRSGFIKESLGTHGYFKASFDGKITSQDVVAMALFKRVWPQASHMYPA